MSDTSSTIKLLPSGLRDTLAPEAAHERYITNILLDRFALFGYQQVSAPLLEFEDTLFAGKGAAHKDNSFRVMDTASQKMMALRADITTQIERIALRLPQSTAPKRLSYAGHVLRVSPDGLSSERQLRQAGMEMIGASVSEAEILNATVEGLQALGLNKLVITLSLAGAFELLFSDCASTLQHDIRKAIYHKDSGSLPEATTHKPLIEALLQQDISSVLASHTLPDPLKIQAQHMLSLAETLTAHYSADVTVLTDALDAEGFDYHEGICFTILDATSRQEIARGGCYTLPEDLKGCGITLYIERLLASAIAKPEAAEQHTIPATMPYAEAKKLRDQSIITITEY